MYAVIGRRRRNDARQQETRQLAQQEFVPKLQAAPGFVATYLIADGPETVSIAIWESQAAADAFQPTAEAWGQTLEAHGHQFVSRSGGEVLGHVTAKS